MAILKVESWVGISVSQAARKWSVYGNNPSSSQTGRWGGSSRAFRFGNAGVGYGVANLATVILGGAYNLNGNAPNENNAVMWGRDGATTQWTLVIDASYHLILRRGTSNGGTILATSTLTVPSTGWFYLELKVVTNGSTGSVVAKVNMTEYLNTTSLDTNLTSNDFVNEVGYGAEPNGNGNTMDIMDMYISDTTGSSPQNDFLGDVRVEGLLPSGNGNSSQLSGSDGNSTDNYLLVDETEGDDDTTYVESSTVGQKDTYAYGNLTPTTGTVLAVALTPIAKKTDAGTRSIASVARLSATEVDSSDKALTASYAGYQDIRTTKPGGGAWSISDVNSAEFGVKVTA